MADPEYCSPNCDQTWGTITLKPFIFYFTVTEVLHIVLRDRKMYNDDGGLSLFGFRCSDPCNRHIINYYIISYPVCSIRVTEAHFYNNTITSIAHSGFRF